MLFVANGRVPEAADWLFSRAGGEARPVWPVLDTLPVLFGLRDTDSRAVGRLPRTMGSGTGRDDVVWEWETSPFHGGRSTPAQIHARGSETVGQRCDFRPISDCVLTAF